MRLSSITSRSANLLDVIRHADRCIEVHDKFNIGDINTHRERGSRNHNLSFALQEVEQQLFLAAFRVDSRVIAGNIAGVYFSQNVVQRIDISRSLSKDQNRAIRMVFKESADIGAEQAQITGLRFSLLIKSPM